MRQETADPIAAQAELTEPVTAGSEWTKHQRHRAKTPEQHASRAADQIDDISRKLTTTRKQLRHWQSQTAGQRAELAGLRSELTATRTAIETEKPTAANGSPTSKPATRKRSANSAPSYARPDIHNSNDGPADEPTRTTGDQPATYATSSAITLCHNVALPNSPL